MPIYGPLIQQLAISLANQDLKKLDLLDSLDSLSLRGKKGRPSKTTIRIERETIRKIEQDQGLSVPKLTKDLQTDHCITVNFQTVCNRLKKQGRIMVWGSFPWSGVGELKFIDGIMTKEVYTYILKQKLRSSARCAGLYRNFIFQQDGDQKHSSK
ncbi:uncharacterized protein LOC136091022 [Hydra vulgaris]|uniref:Uncharacterized protein LOC136091022 n=1 Tax=Hydra vulgaris TaxID=6087 RepID=A0ABM4DHV6_HYDVU